jgi:hypothetical protein
MSDPKETVDDVEPELEGDDPAEGAGESEAVDDADGGDEDGEPDEGADDSEAEPGGEAEVTPKPAPKPLSVLHREQKAARKEAEGRAAEATRKSEEALRRAEAAERRAEEAERAANARRQQETQEAEAARIELMSESEKVAHYRQKDGEEFNRKFQTLQYQQWDSTDRMEFRQLCRDKPLFAKVKEKVEAEFERMRAQGRPVAREILAKQEIANLVLSDDGTTGRRQRERAAAGVRRETVKPRQARSDVAPARSRRSEDNSKAARYDRLKDVIL